MTKTESLARRKCANYNVGKCSGIMFIRNESGKQIYQVLSKEHEGKNCFADKGCDYFNQVVIRNVDVN